MNRFGVLVLCGLVCGMAVAQQPLARDEALRQLYRNYEPSSKTAEWVCTTAQGDSGPIVGWACTKDNRQVSIDVLLAAQVDEGGTAKTYFVVSAKPDLGPDGFNCHMCSPAIGTAVFAWKGGHWTLESANPACGFYGSYGDAPEADLAAIGPEKHGVWLSWSDLAQGYAWSSRVLLMPVRSTVRDVWGIQDEQDNEGAYDPDDRSSEHVRYRSSAMVKLLGGGKLTTDQRRDYYDIEVISTGTDRQAADGKLKDENWTEVYRYNGGEYKLLRHTALGAGKKTAVSK